MRLNTPTTPMDISSKLQNWQDNSNLTMFSNLHIYKTNSILQAVATGVDPSDIEVFVEHHKGRDPTNPDWLSTPGATTALVIYFHFLLGWCVVLPY
jgi:hypothetical protein